MGKVWFPLSNSRRHLDGSFNLKFVTGEQIEVEAGATGVLGHAFLIEVPAPTGLDGSCIAPILTPDTLTEVQGLPTTGEYFVNYNSGEILFNESEVGQIFNVDYYARGSLIEVEDINALWRSLGLTATGAYQVGNPTAWGLTAPLTISEAIDRLREDVTGSPATGPRGVTGIVGWTGLVGPTGVSGNTGIQGLTGIWGTTGTQGSTGTQGTTGLRGFTGIQGSTGIAFGATGPQGLQGATGICCASGAGVTSLDQLSVGVPPTDGTYEDGLFLWTAEYNAADALDDVNEVLKALAPPPAPALQSINGNEGVTGKLSFGPTNGILGYNNHPSLDINDIFNTSGDNQGILDATTNISGNLNPTISAHTYAYSAGAFGPGDIGSLSLIVNGVVVHTVDLSSFVSGSTLNANGSGFILSVSQPVEFSTGSPFEAFQYRTGTYLVTPADQQNGYNTVQVAHTVGSATTNELKYIIDDDTTTTTYTSSSLSSLAMTGSKWLSGVNYHTGGTAQYALTINNPHRNTYSISSSAVNHSGIRCTVSDSSLGNITDESDQEILSNVLLTASGTRILTGFNGVGANQSLGVNTTLDRTVQADITSSTTYDFNLLMDNQSPNSNESYNEYFNDETYRVRTDSDFTSPNDFYNGTLSKRWTTASGSTNPIYDAGIIGFNDGTQVINGLLLYPSLDFRNLSDGGSVFLDGPSGNPDYSGGACTGERVYVRYFRQWPVTYQNFKLNVSLTNCTWIPATNKGSLTGNQCTMEFCAPGETKDASNNFEWKDAIVPYTVDKDPGCYSASIGNGIPTNWGITIGTKSTANSDGIVCIRFTCSASWNGSLNSIALTWVS